MPGYIESMSHLIKAIISDNILMFDIYVNSNVIDSQDSLGRTALMYAVRSRSISSSYFVEKLLEYNADTSIIDDQGHTALLEAAFSYSYSFADSDKYKLFLDKFERVCNASSAVLVNYKKNDRSALFHILDRCDYNGDINGIYILLKERGAVLTYSEYKNSLHPDAHKYYLETTIYHFLLCIVCTDTGYIPPELIYEIFITLKNLT